MKFRFEFHGGFKDGEVVKGDTEAAEMDGGTKAYRFLTDHGRVECGSQKGGRTSPGY